MAIAEGSVVAVRLRSAAGATLLIGQLTAQPPQFGRVESISGTVVTVDWANGARVTSIETNTGVLDEIVKATDVNRDAFLGQLVQQLNSEGTPQPAAARMLVIAVYIRDPSGANVTMALCKFINADAWSELPITELAVVTG